MIAIRSSALRALVFGLLMAASALSSNAQTYPERVVKIIVPNPPGNVGDIVARMLAWQLGRTQADHLRWSARIRRLDIKLQ